MQKKLEKQKTKKRISSILIVHTFGNLANINKEFINFCKKKSINIIEDAAQSFGAEYFGTKVGKNAKITCVSFFPAKPLGCYGDGGAVFTNDDGCDKWGKPL